VCATFSGFIALELEDGIGRVRIDHRHAGEGPVAHGGVSMSLAEATAASLPSLQGFTCLSAANQLVGPARRNDELIAIASLTRQTRTLAFVSVRVHQDQRDVLLAPFVFAKAD
jgi:acyl-coenzyme A thioesterase PaaI-like protein